MKKASRIFFLCFTIVFFSCETGKKKIELPFYNTPDFTAQWIHAGDKNYDSIHVIAPFSFVNQNGVSITNKNTSGKIYVANFFFTTCGSICPRMMNNLKKLQTAFANDTNVLILSHSVLPETDSVARLKKYATQMKINSDRWWLLTGNKEAIYTMARKSYFADADLGYNKSSKDFLHTENCVLIDQLGRIRGVYNATLELEIDKLIEHVRLLE